VVEDINSALCQIGGYQVGHTSDGYESARSLWEGAHRSEFTLIEAADLCRCCHRLSPFLFLNGNTFVAAARIAFRPAFEDLPDERRSFARAGVGHYIAGTIGKDELLPLLGLKAQ
jgi:hypothetical protein